METDTERALWALEEALDGVVSLVRGAAYGLRLAAKRVGDVSGSASPTPTGKGATGEEFQRLIEALEFGEDRLSDVAVLAMGDHFRVFVGRALELAEIPALPPTPRAVEQLCGVPDALSELPFWFPLVLQLYRAALQGGRLDRSCLEALGVGEIELPYPGGKVKMHREGDHVTLTEHQTEQVAESLLEAGRAIRLRLLTA
jgi:hypothetical protein